MTKTKVKTKKNSIAQLTMSVMLAMFLSIGVALPAYAVDDLLGAIQGTEESPAQAAITKVLELPTGTDVPNATFRFKVEGIEFNGSSSNEIHKNMPTIGNGYGYVEINISDTADLIRKDDGKGTTRVYLESQSLFKDVEWPGTGTYTYRIQEVNNTYECQKSEPVEHMFYSDGEYKIQVFVDRASDGTLYVKYLSDTVTKVDSPKQVKYEKVDPTPGGNPNIDGDYSKMIFTNNYYKDNTPSQPDPVSKSALKISKQVTGELADPAKYFDFEVMVANPATIVNAKKVYKAYVVDEKGIVSKLNPGQAPATKIKNDGTNDYIEFTTAITEKIQLKHGQSLSFVDLPVGSTFSVKEVSPQNYIASLEAKINGEVKESKISAALGGSLGLDKSKAWYVGENGATVDFTNTFRTVAPMGIAVDNLPYIAIAVLSLVALAGFIVTRVRKKVSCGA